MHLPVNPPVAPMLAKPVKEIPDGPYSYEPKWDGFRSIVFADGGEVEIGSRNERPMTRYFPELVAAVTEQFPRRCVIDGEIVVPGRDGRRLDFEALLQRIHPAASRVNLLATQTPAHFIAFDLLALGDTDYTERPFAQRRAALAEALAGVAAPAAPDPGDHRPGPGRGGGSPSSRGPGWTGSSPSRWTGMYEPDRRVMFKVKHERTADCVVAGYRTHKSSAEAIGSLLLGLYRDDGKLASVGVIGAFPMERRPGAVHRAPAAGHHVRRASVELGAGQEAGTRTPRAAEHSRWNATKDLSFTPLRPERVVEVRYDHMEGPRFRHTAQFVRWRPDRDPRSCTYEQLEEPVSFDLATEHPAAGRGQALTPHVPAEQVAVVGQHVGQTERGRRRCRPGSAGPGRPRSGRRPGRPAAG